MIELIYKTAKHHVIVLVNTNDVIEAQRLVKASDDEYQQMVGYTHCPNGDVYFVKDEKR